ncbi:hypothetical protein TL16_g12837 [Triparma laevis f. inornata]|uniref:Aminomethyltransferase folate-binding domain-containing protein n=2 Tax=Triparma laevis TaxID=1534972 RepID=A0A9W7EIQ5_9STRA|nr:hypothetical protein TrLO_g3590 [Triparma laevis f. longispina]GMH94200.1 hypothetical protein TL16_g12837 [Triparma laevis f. inornata]
MQHITWSLSRSSLKNNKLLKIGGSAATDFLQGLITQKLPLESPSSYTALCDIKGRIISSAHIFTLPDGSYLLSSETSSLGHLKPYILRKQRKLVTLEDVTDKFTATAILGTGKGVTMFDGDGVLACAQDSIGVVRLITDETVDLQNVFNEKVKESLVGYKFYRRVAGFLSSREAKGMTVYEANVDLLNGISYDKGCYLGQETVARGYHKGQIRKRCMPAVIFPEDWEGTIEDGETELSVASKLNFETGKEGGQEFEVLKGDLVEFEDKKVATVVTPPLTAPGKIPTPLILSTHVDKRPNWNGSMVKVGNGWGKVWCWKPQWWGELDDRGRKKKTNDISLKMTED